jgi:hypothetical protein
MKLMGDSKSTMTTYYSHDFEDGGKAARDAIMAIGRLLDAPIAVVVKEWAHHPGCRAFSRRRRGLLKPLWLHSPAN